MKFAVEIELKPDVGTINVAAYLRGVERQILLQPTPLGLGDGAEIVNLDGETVGRWCVEEIARG